MSIADGVVSGSGRRSYAQSRVFHAALAPASLFAFLNEFAISVGIALSHLLSGYFLLGLCWGTFQSSLPWGWGADLDGIILWLAFGYSFSLSTWPQSR